MRTRTIILIAVLTCLSLQSAGASGVPRSALLMKENGDAALAGKRYADAVDHLIQAVSILPGYPEAHFNLGVAFLVGYKAYGPARHHFERYLDLLPDAPDRLDVQALIVSLGQRAKPVTSERTVLAVIGGRLLVGGGGWVKSGDPIDIAEPGKDPCACLVAEYVYPDSVLTRRIRDDKTLGVVRVGLLAVNHTP